MPWRKSGAVALPLSAAAGGAGEAAVGRNAVSDDDGVAGAASRAAGGGGVHEGRRYLRRHLHCRPPADPAAVVVPLAPMVHRVALT
ncbi:MAG: hypothetical protein IPH26_03605 [Sterolibacteriaceae bacterium]|uniref:Uncharacterized protein n=1 Tax=Candidatus Methylophosphatis roskildensis TaxID=2899263 RepID=A0A9D7DWD2_9PROT|nr:hypothetical protein [Candidatus Methylophosphatis roskildensis]